MVDRQQTRHDILKAARLAGVEYSQETIDRVLSAFEDKLTTQAIDFKTTNQPLPKRGMYFRYLEYNNRGLAWERSCQSGLLLLRDRPVDRFVPEISEKFPLQADGVDFEVQHGLAKIWLFPEDFFAMAEVFNLSSLPPAVKSYADFFKEYHLNSAVLVAADYQHNSMNLYFPNLPGVQDQSQFYSQFLQTLNCQLPSEELLNIFVRTAGIALTFSWDSEIIERVCFYVPGLPREQAATYVDSSPKAFIEQCPTLTEDAATILGWSFSPGVRGKDYVKIEIDYTGNVLQFLKDMMLRFPLE